MLHPTEAIGFRNHAKSQATDLRPRASFHGVGKPQTNADPNETEAGVGRVFNTMIQSARAKAPTIAGMRGGGTGKLRTGN